MAVQFGVSVPQGWTMDLVEIADPEEKYEAMTRAAKEADRLGYDSIWLFDHFHGSYARTGDHLRVLHFTGGISTRDPTREAWSDGHLQWLSEPGTPRQNGFDD